MRLPSVIAATLCVLIVSLFVRQLLGPIGGFISTFLLCTTYGFSHLAVDGRVDMVFSLFVISAVILWLAIESRYVFYLIGALSGFAILAKGPLGAALPIIIISSIALITRGLAGLKSLIHPGWILTVLVPLPWFWLAFAQGGDAFLKRQVVFENMSRFSGGEGIPIKPWWFYLGHMWLQAAPWSFVAVIILALVLLNKKNLRDRKSVLNKSMLTNKAFIGSVVWIVIPLIVFSLSAGKRRAYLLPLLPAYAILLSLVFEENKSKFLELRQKHRTWIFQFLVVVQLAFLIFIPAGLIYKGYTHTYRNFARRVSELVPVETPIRFVKTLREESYDGFMFYFGRHVITHLPTDSNIVSGTYIARQSWLTKNNLQVEELARGGRKVDSRDEELVLFRVN